MYYRYAQSQFCLFLQRISSTISGFGSWEYSFFSSKVIFFLNYNSGGTRDFWMRGVPFSCLAHLAVILLTCVIKSARKQTYPSHQKSEPSVMMSAIKTASCSLSSGFCKPSSNSELLLYACFLSIKNWHIWLLNVKLILPECYPSDLQGYYFSLFHLFLSRFFSHFRSNFLLTWDQLELLLSVPDKYCVLIHKVPTLCGFSFYSEEKVY